jgi:hypothetical protein
MPAKRAGDYRGIYMSDLNLNASAGIDPSTPFCARTYFEKIREEGCNPIVRDCAFYIYLTSTGDTGAGRWAALQDPDGTARKEYARAAWDNRRNDNEVILLGTGALPDLAELTTVSDDGTVSVETIRIGPL